MSFWNAFKGARNDGFEMGRTLWASGAASLIGFQGYDIHLGHPLDPLQFGSGFAALMVASGFGIAAKDRGVAESLKPPPQTNVSGDLNAQNVEHVEVQK
jgi:hypothetical protein